MKSATIPAAWNQETKLRRNMPEPYLNREKYELKSVPAEFNIHHLISTHTLSLASTKSCHQIFNRHITFCLHPEHRSLVLLIQDIILIPLSRCVATSMLKL